jgi:hypothetical protein
MITVASAPGMGPPKRLPQLGGFVVRTRLG